MAEKHAKRGLGTGLGALFGDDSVSAGEGKVLTVPISKVEPRSDQPRQHFDEERLAELADSLRQYGLIQPITVRKLPSGYYQIIAGERRWRAARMAGLQEVPVRVLEADDRRTTELALVENLQREDLNPIDEARGYQTLLQEYAMTQEEAAQCVGRSRPAVANALRLLFLTPPVLEMVEKEALSAGHGRALLAIQDPEMQLEAAKKIAAEGLSVRQTETLCARLARAAARPAEAPPQDRGEIRVDYLEEVRRQLERALARKVTIKEGRKRGKIELEYYDADDREALIRSLTQMGSRTQRINPREEERGER